MRSYLLALTLTALALSIPGGALCATKPAATSNAPGAGNTGGATTGQATKPASLSALPAGAILIPLCRQATDYTCGAAALQGVLGFFGEDLNESQLARPLKSNSKIGTRYEAIAEFARHKGYEVNIYKNATIRKLEELLDQQQPVIVLIQAWSEKPFVDYSHDWEDGHYVVAIGYDANNMYFMDPSTLGHYTFIPLQEFEARWHDKDTSEKLHHFAMTITRTRKKGSAFTPEKVEYMP